MCPHRSNNGILALTANRPRGLSRAVVAQDVCRKRGGGGFQAELADRRTAEGNLTKQTKARQARRLGS